MQTQGLELWMQLIAGVEPVIRDESWDRRAAEERAGTRGELRSGPENWTVMGITLGQERGAEGQDKPRSEVRGQE